MTPERTLAWLSAGACIQDAQRETLLEEGMQAPPLLQVLNDFVGHHMLRIPEPEQVSRLEELFKPPRISAVDGHPLPNQELIQYARGALLQQAKNRLSEQDHAGLEAEREWLWKRIRILETGQTCYTPQQGEYGAIHYRLWLIWHLDKKGYLPQNAKRWCDRKLLWIHIDRLEIRAILQKLYLRFCQEVHTTPDLDAWAACFTESLLVSNE